MPHNIIIAGSLNMDFVVHVQRLPAPGETTLGSHFEMIAGGKGANQAAAVGRLGEGTVNARMIGRVGDDPFGIHLKASLTAAGVDTAGVRTLASEPTGVAFIPVDENGENSIIVAPGANHSFRADEVDSHWEMLKHASYVLLQLEIPLQTVEAMIALAKRTGVRVMLDPAPAAKLPEGLLSQVDVLTPNETEANLLLGRAAANIQQGREKQMAADLLALGVGSVVLKLGSRGCFYFDGETEIFSPAFSVNAVDTTAAGDIFNGGLAVALAEGKAWPSALQFANAASALSVTRRGAQSSVPLRNDVDAFLKSVAS